MSVGRSREELLAAAAALTGAVHDVEDLETAAVLTERAKQFEEESLDAPPISALGEVTDDRIVNAIGFVWGTAATTSLVRVGLPGPVAEGIARQTGAQVLEDPLIRDELVTAVRAALQGRCACGKAAGHSGEHPTRRRWIQ